VLAEEVTQEVFVLLWRHPERFDPAKGGIRGFLVAMARLRAIDALRAEGARRRREVRHGPVWSPIDDEIDARLLRGEREARVAAAVRALPAPERDVVSLTFYGRHSYRRAAELLGRPEGTTKSQVRAGLRRLGTSLADERTGPAPIEAPTAERTGGPAARDGGLNGAGYAL
jgi:RNA polymerase sigma-70 factor (ECF subfamily)